MTVTSISNNFGSETITLKSHMTDRLVILDGVVHIDTANDAYLAAEQLEVDFSQAFTITESGISSAVLASGNGKDCFATVIKCRITGSSRLVMEKLPIYDGRENVRIYLNSAFVTPGIDSALSAAEPVALGIEDPEYKYMTGFGQYANTFDEQWGYLGGYFKRTVFQSGDEYSFRVNGFPEDADTFFPIFMSDSYSEDFLGTRIYPAHFAGGILTFTPECNIANDIQNEAFFSFFFVRGE